MTIDGNEISCDKTYIEVYNDITLKLIDLTITAPDKAGVESSAMVLNKTDDETDQMNIIVSGTCNLTGSSWEVVFAPYTTRIYPLPVVVH